MCFLAGESPEAVVHSVGGGFLFGRQPAVEDRWETALQGSLQIPEILRVFYLGTVLSRNLVSGCTTAENLAPALWDWGLISLAQRSKEIKLSLGRYFLALKHLGVLALDLFWGRGVSFFGYCCLVLGLF